MSGPSFGWEWQDWHFVLFDVRCHCGWFLSKAEPVMRYDWLGGGVQAVEGDCKRHGHVRAATWNIIDAAEFVA